MSYAYDANANLTGINYPNMPDVSMSYNALDDVTQIVDGVGTHGFTYDNIGKLLSLDGPFANDEQTFGYDSLQRLSGQSVQRGASGGVQAKAMLTMRWVAWRRSLRAAHRASERSLTITLA